MTEQPTFVAASEYALPDLLGWALARPAALGPSFELLGTAVPLPNGRTIPALGAATGAPVLVYAFEEPGDTDVAALASLLGLLRREPGLLAARFPQLRAGGPAPRLVALAARFGPRFLEAADGLAVSDLLLLRVRTLEAADGSRLVLAEREGSRPAEPPPPAPSNAPETEEAFFHALEAERRGLRGA